MAGHRWAVLSAHEKQREKEGNEREGRHSGRAVRGRGARARKDSGSLDRNELHLEHERGLGRNLSHCSIAVREIRRDGELSLAAGFQPDQSLIPPLDHGAVAQLEREGGISTARAVELRSIEEVPNVVHLQRISRLCSRTGSWCSVHAEEGGSAAVAVLALRRARPLATSNGGDTPRAALTSSRSVAGAFGS